MAIGQSWLADDDGYDTSTPYYHSSVYGWYNGFVWWVRFLSTLHLLLREEELRSMGKAFSLASPEQLLGSYYSPTAGFDHWTHAWSLVYSLLPSDSALCVKATSGYAWLRLSSFSVYLQLDEGPGENHRLHYTSSSSVYIHMKHTCNSHLTVNYHRVLSWASVQWKL